MTATGDGVFFDGQAPVPLSVAIQLTGDALVVLAADGGAPVVSWRLGEVDIVDRRGQQLTLARRGGEARLKVADAALAARLAAALAPGLRGRARRQTARWFAAGLAVVAGLALFLTAGWPLVADGIAAVIPDPWFARLGDSTATALIGRQKTCADPRAQAILDGLARRLARAADREPPMITVASSPVSNAFALPGNRIVILSGLITEAKHANEIAGVLGHEMGHLAGRHPARHFVRQAGLFLLVELFTGGSSLGGFGATAVATGYSRAFEREADDFARQVLKAAAIDARPVAGFFERMAAKEGLGLPGLLGSYLSTHPDPAERAKAFAAADGGQTALSEASFAALKKICGR